MFLILLFIIGITSVDLSKVNKKFQKLPREEFIKYFNGKKFSYKIREYNRNFNFSVPNNLPTNEYRKFDIETREPHCEMVLPENFDARLKWTHCETIQDIYDQEIDKCGSCWAFAATTTASDRICIHKNRTVRLSQMDLIHASPHPETICYGGNPLYAFKYWIDEGIVTDKCKPYNLNEVYIEKRRYNCTDKSLAYKGDKHFGKEVYYIDGNDASLRCELFKNGPVTGAFKVFEDFAMYSSGVYEHLFGKFLYYHAVRIIGYGIENGVKYWLVANSFGASWGQHGVFKIKRFSCLGLDSKVLGVYPK